MTSPPTLSRLRLLGMALVFFGPLIIAVTLYHNPQLLTYKSTHHGELINPAQPLAALNAASGNYEKLPDDLLRGKWTLLYWNDADCDLNCEASLFKMRQVRLSVSKDMDRVQTVYLSEEPLDSLSSTPLKNHHPQLIIGHFLQKEDDALKKQMHAYPKSNIYVVDPLGNLMLQYSNTASSKGILKDLKKLLRVSRIG